MKVFLTGLEIRPSGTQSALPQSVKPLDAILIDCHNYKIIRLLLDGIVKNRRIANLTVPYTRAVFFSGLNIFKKHSNKYSFPIIFTYPFRLLRMKKTAFLIIVVMICACSCADPGDPEKVLARARKYFQQGEYEKALQDHIWFHDNALKYKPSLYGIRITFALLDWIELGQKYPKAHNELIDIRNRKADLIKTRHGTLELFHDVQSINKYLNDRQKTIDLYKDMTVCDFELAKRCYCVAKEDLIVYQEFGLCNRLMDVPMFIIRDMRQILDQNIQIYKTNQWADEAHLEWTIKHYLKEAEFTLIVLVKNKRFIEADRFLAEASEGIDIARIKSGLADLKNKYMTST